MPQKKRANTKNSKKGSGNERASSKAKKVTGKSSRKKAMEETAEVNVQQELDIRELGIFAQLVPYILAVIGVFTLICLFSESTTGFVGHWIRTLLYGFFGAAAFAVPILIFVIAFYWKKAYVKGNLKYKVILSALLLAVFAMMLHMWLDGAEKFSLVQYWTDGMILKGGGIIGGSVSVLLNSTVGSIGTHIIGFSLFFIFLMLLFGFTPYTIWLYCAYLIHERRAKTEVYEEEKPKQVKYILSRKPKAEPMSEDDMPDVGGGRRRFNSEANLYDKRRFDPDVDMGDGLPSEPVQAESDEDTSFDGYANIDEAAFEEALRATEAYPYGDGTGSIDQIDNSFYASDDDAPPFDLDDNVGYTYEAVKPVNREIVRDMDGSAAGNIFEDEDGIDVLTRFTEEQKKREEERLERLRAAENGEDELMISRGRAIDGDLDEAEEKKEYIFPPTSMLNIDTSPKDTNIGDELHSNAVKLVDTLNSFKVRTRIVNVSRGPTITRYELVPEEGIRVRSIANLVDDIALNLATSGVRIEAPIPGKSAVGIEVPNKIVSTVYLRELIDSAQFANASSRVTVALGVDVAGTPVFLDIAKMPHLLIAGATGMGKSVCINSMLVSLLYKANPDEVKFILIDPKKVELNIYNGLPHLLVPVVSDPKKAAGSLQWAVSEMERRFVLIEEVGVRDLKSYNNVTKDDPDKEFLPQIVIVIDELADLMMTASDDVETSICRLAQKARAAGMHLIIGTQRPSVDVITGLIKANIPSRISFRVSALMDSRVILDMAGAEKLIGRGDMLCAPVGVSKPMRIQGAFVSEKEIENIVEFIKTQAKGEYRADVMESIDRAAEMCGQKKGASSGGLSKDEVDSQDPMLKPAIELAVESGKISTSLIQRRLSLGYGRAAKLIDEMQNMGIVSAPEGQKPRTVLITKQQYMEMVLSGEENIE